MAKRKAFLHVGLDDRSGDFLDAALEHHEHALSALGVRRPATSGEEMFRAAIEIRREHRAWGFTRPEVEGAWTRIVRRGLPGRDTLVFSQTLLADSTPDQVALLLDALAGFKVHVVLTVAAPDTWTDPGLDLGALLDRWARAVGRPDRVHVIIAPPDRSRRTVWKRFGRVVGFGTSSLPLDGVGRPAVVRPPRLVSLERQRDLQDLGRRWAMQVVGRGYDVHGEVADLVTDLQSEVDPAAQASASHEALHEALDEALRLVERLRRRNETLETRVVELEHGRRRLRRGTRGPSAA